MAQVSAGKPPEVAKKKKWSLGGLFRRKSRKSESDSSSSEDGRDERKRKGFLGRKKKSERGSKDVTDSFFINPAPRGTPESTRSGSLTSLEGRRRTKAKVEASREMLGSSSGEEGFSSQAGSLHSRRSRAARTERYMRRMSKELEEGARWRAHSASPAHSPKRGRHGGSTSSMPTAAYPPSPRIPAPPPRRPPDPRPLSYAFEPHRTSSEQILTRPIGQRNSVVEATPPRPQLRPPHMVQNGGLPSEMVWKNGGLPEAVWRGVPVGIRNGHEINRVKPVREASEFWRRQEEQLNLARNIPRIRHVRTDSGGSMSSSSDISNRRIAEEKKVSSLPRRLEEDFRPLSIVVEKSEPSDMENVTKLKPPTPPERKSSRQSSISTEIEPVRERTSNNLEEALNELEAIYRSLKLGEEDLLDKRSRLSRGAESDSGFYCRETDDMAYRRLNKKETSYPDNREIISRAGSFLLVSPTLSPPPLVRVVPPPLTNVEPDITLDDVVYRTVNHTKNTLRILDPQPPFGIPLGPVSPAAGSDYLHVDPASSPLQDNSPDPITDDLAFRALRKDSARDSTLTTKKKKAVRSLSANLSNFINRDRFEFPVKREVNNNHVEQPPKRLNATEGMRLAQRMLDNRRKALYRRDRESSAPAEIKTPSKDELRRRFFAEAYKTLEESKESQLLRQLEEEARATSDQIGKELRELGGGDDDNKSVTELLQELSRSLEHNREDMGAG